MQDFPHHYPASARAQADGLVTLASPGLTSLASDAPSTFGGGGEHWSPETLVSAAVADCFILTFRVVARASKMAFLDLVCEVDGELDRVERVIRFTRFDLRARLTVPVGEDPERARALLEKAERACLVSRSLLAPVSFHPEVVVAD